MLQNKHVIDRLMAEVVARLFSVFRIAPGLLGVVVAGVVYWGWTQSRHIDHICHNLFAAFDDTARGGGYPLTLGFEDTVDLLEKMPTLRNAARRCREVRDYSSAYDVFTP